MVACGESFVLPGGQTSRSVDAAQGAAHGIGYNSRATIVLLVTATGMFCDKASWSIVSRHRGPSLFFQKSTFWVPPRFTIGQLLHEPRDALGSAACGAAGRCPWSRAFKCHTYRRPDLC